jgi:hypothetical protein
MLKVRGAYSSAVQSLAHALTSLDAIFSSFSSPSSSSSSSASISVENADGLLRLENVLAVLLRNYQRCSEKNFLYGDSIDAHENTEGNVLQWVLTLNNIISVLGENKLTSLVSSVESGEGFHFDFTYLFPSVYLVFISTHPISPPLLFNSFHFLSSFLSELSMRACIPYSISWIVTVRYEIRRSCIMGIMFNHYLPPPCDHDTKQTNIPCYCLTPGFSPPYTLLILPRVISLSFPIINIFFPPPQALTCRLP